MEAGRCAGGRARKRVIIRVGEWAGKGYARVRSLVRAVLESMAMPVVLVMFVSVCVLGCIGGRGGGALGWSLWDGTLFSV